MKHLRTIALERAADAAADEIKLAISSEAPYERWFGIEILGHSPAEVDLTRLGDGRHPLLLGHDPQKQIGVITSTALGEDRKLRGTAKLSKSDLGQEIKQDVEDGIRTLVSVGYMVDEMQEMEPAADGTMTPKRTLKWADFEAEQRALFGENFYRAGPPASRKGGDAIPVYRVTRWTPFEASLVAVPADVTVGVGRSAAEAEVKPQPQQPQDRIETIPDKKQEKRPMSEPKKPEELERERTAALLSLGEQYKKYIVDKDVADAIRNGKSADQFREVIMEKMAAKHSDTSALHVGMSGKEVQRYSLARACAAAMTGDWSKAGLEMEANRAVAALLKQQPNGFFVPWDYFARDFNVGTGSEAGNLVATELRTDLFVDVLRNKYVLGQLGVRILAGLTSSIDIPKKTVASSISRVTEIAALTETNPNTGKVSLSPKRFGGYVEYSKQALIQSSIAIEPMLRDDLLTGALLDIQDQWLNGSGSGANMRGIRNTSGIGSVVGGTNGANLAWSHVVGLESACANANAEPDRFSGYLINTKTRGTSKTTQKATNLPFIWDAGDMPLNGYRAMVSNTVPSNLTKGTSTTVCSSVIFGSDWSMSVIGLFGAPDVTVDPYSLATTGQVRITLNQFGDHGVRIAACFATSDDILTP